MFGGLSALISASRLLAPRTAKATRKRTWWFAFVRSTLPSGRSNTMVLPLLGSCGRPGLRTRTRFFRFFGDMAWTYRLPAYLRQSLGVRSTTGNCHERSAPPLTEGGAPQAAGGGGMGGQEQHVPTPTSSQARDEGTCSVPFEGTRGFHAGSAEGEFRHCAGALGDATLQGPW
jgi:hypothetical protein